MTKDKLSETNYLAIPPAITPILRQTGINFYCYYENVRSCPKNFRLRRRFSFYCLLHFIDGDCALADDAHPEPHPLKVGQGLLVPPGVPQEYGAFQNYFVEDSICFTGPTADAFLQAGIIRHGIIEIGRERILLPLINRIRAGTLTDFLSAGVMLQQLLLDLHHDNSTSHFSEPQRRLQRLLTMLNQHPQEWWTVKNMAEFCNISENYLRRLFLEQTGMSPKEYVEQMKMRQAVELLTGTNLQVNEIATRLGYADPYHFNRRFAARTGLPPGRYRQSHATNLAASHPLDR